MMSAICTMVVARLALLNILSASLAMTEVPEQKQLGLLDTIGIII